MFNQQTNCCKQGGSRVLRSHITWAFSTTRKLRPGKKGARRRSQRPQDHQRQGRALQGGLGGGAAHPAGSPARRGRRTLAPRPTPRLRPAAGTHLRGSPPAAARQPGPLRALTSASAAAQDAEHMRRVRPGQAQSSPAGSGVGAPRAEAKGRDSWGRGRDAQHAGPALGAGPRERDKRAGLLEEGLGAKHAGPAMGAGPRGRRQRGGTLGAGAERPSTQVAWTFPSRSGRTSVSAWVRRWPLAEPPSEPRPRPSAGSRPFPSGSTLCWRRL